MELLGFPPGNVHSKFVAFELEVLLNNTVKGAQPLVGLAVNPATGGVTTVTVCVLVAVPQALVAVNTTV